jgi:predicted lipid-binding transport protein (Tim44 family)
MLRLKPTITTRLSAAVLVAMAALFIGSSFADARVGGGSSFGSRGVRTYTAPPATRTSPGPASPIERSITQPGRSTYAPTAGVAQPRPGWGSSFGGLLMGGLLGAGLFGLLSGAGLFAGLGSLAGMMGFLLQIALIGGLVWVAMAFFRNRQIPAMAGPGAGMARGGLGGYGGNRNGARGSVASGTELALQQADFDAFERLLGRIQTAYGKEDVSTLRALASPEMVSYLADDLAANERKGVRNEISGVHLLSGDLSEAWREPNAEYATVAIRFELIDTMIDRTTARIVSGNASVPTEVTEVWTFLRQPGSGPNGWRLSAIQQSGR